MKFHVFTFGLLLLTSIAQAANVVYYDPDTGSDLNPGTKEQPLKTVEKARATLVGAGQIISPLGVSTYTGPSRKMPTPPPR